MRQDPSRVYPATSDIRRQLAASGCGRGSGDNLRKEAHKSRPGMVLPRWAEGVGFEPTMTVTSHSGFQDPYGNRADLHRYPVRLVAWARIRHDQGPSAPRCDRGAHLSRRCERTTITVRAEGEPSWAEVMRGPSMARTLAAPRADEPATPYVVVFTWGAAASASSHPKGSGAFRDWRITV